MAISYVGANTTTHTTNQTALSFTIPGGAGSGDLMIAVCYQSSNTAAGIWDDDGGGGNGWTRAAYYRDTSGRDRETAIYWKIHSGSETNPTFTHGTSSPMNGSLVVFSGTDNVDPFYAIEVLRGSNDAAPPNASVTGPGSTNWWCMVVHCMTHDDISAALQPSTYTSRVSARQSPSWDHTDHHIATKLIATAGATESPGDWLHTVLNTTPEYHCYSIAIQELQPVHISDVNTDDRISAGEEDVPITGDGFEAIQGTGKVELWDDLTGTTKVAQTVATWSATSITFDVVQGSLDDGVCYVVVTNDSGENNAPYEVVLGTPPYKSVIEILKSDHYWALDNSYSDEGITGPVRDLNTSDHATDYGFFTASGSVIAEDSNYAWKMDAVTEAREIEDSPNMNITITSGERTVAGWVQLGGIQQSLGAIWKEGGGVQNLAFVVGVGNVLLAQGADNPGNAINAQAWSDIRLIPDRPYHICLRYSLTESPKEFRLFLDGEEQTVTDGNPLGAGSFNSHSGNVVWGDPDNNLETGGTDIAYSGQVDCIYSHWATWSDNSLGTNAGALDKVTEIRDLLFRRGAIPKYIITSATASVMQADLNSQLPSGSIVSDWPLGIRVEAPIGSTDLELIADDITFNARTTAHLEWRGIGTLTWVLENGSELDSDKVFSPAETSGSIVIVNAPPITITVKDAATKAVIEDARTYIIAAEGGDLATGSVLISGLTDENGEITTNHRYTSDQPIVGYARSASSSPKYKQGDLSGTIGVNGYVGTIFLINDES